MSGIEDMGQLELVVDFADDGPYLPEIDDEMHSVVIDFSAVSLEHGDGACHIGTQENITMEPSCTDQVTKQPFTWGDIPSRRIEQNSIPMVTESEGKNKEEVAAEASNQIQMLEKQEILSMEDSRENLPLTRRFSSKSVVRHQTQSQRSRERGWNQHCAGANVPLSLKRTTYSLLGRFKTNPVLENCYIAPNSMNKNYKMH